MLDEIIKHVKQKKYYEDLYKIPLEIMEKNPMKHKKNLHIGIINVPCEGYGDIIVCYTFYKYLKEWYPQHKITLCSTTPWKFKNMGYKTKINLISVREKRNEECELPNYHYFKRDDKPKRKFDIIISIPIINYAFNINLFKKFIPYSTLFNTFTVSEYNGYLPPYTFPIGVGKGQLGLFLDNHKTSIPTEIKKPYAVAYIQPSPQIGVHSRTCFIGYMEMVCKKYCKKHKFFQIVVQQWIVDDLNESPSLKTRLKKVVTPYYPNVWITSNDSNESFFEGKGNSLIIRSDILPLPRLKFISLMKYSVPDILLTGDQSITDCLSVTTKKHIWYQIAPWKVEFADNLYKILGDKSLSNFRTSCGDLKGINYTVDYKQLIKQYDFRKLGKIRMNSILSFISNKDVFEEYINIVLKSRKIESVINKLNKL